MKKNVIIFSIFAFSNVFLSCTKEESLSPTDNSPIIASASIDLINEMDIQTGNQVSFEKLTAKKTGKSLAGTCATITSETTTISFPKVFYVDFGTGCTTNGITRKGKLKITFSGFITQFESTMAIERMDYFVNGNKVEGKIEYKNISIDNTPQWTRTVTEGKFTDTKGDIYLNFGTHTVKQTEGIDTFPLEDNTYEMTQGTHTVTKQNGAKITLTVSESLVKKYNCEFVSKGKLKVESTILNGVIDYGNGECDKSGTYTQNGIIFPFNI